jgi:DNA-binding CsgD family transcriptional regulator
MSGYERLRLCDLRKVAELIGEVIELGSDASVWRPHFLNGVRKLLDGNVALSMESEGAVPGGLIKLVAPLDVGWESDELRSRFYQYFTRGEVREDPAAIALFEIMLRVRFATMRRREMVDDKTWYAAPSVYEARRSGNVDDFVFSCVALGPGLLHGFIVYRPWGEEPFAIRHRRLARFIHLVLLRVLIARATDPAGLDELGDLSPRLRQTLELVVAGDAIKHIAMKLGISHHTVNDYIKVLYKRAGVGSRTELANKVRSRPAVRMALPPVFELALAMRKSAGEMDVVEKPPGVDEAQ